MKILIPFTPHLAYECLERLGEKNVNIWPKADEKLIENEVIKIAVQINGKTREIIEANKGSDQATIEKICNNNKKIMSSIKDKRIIKKVFVKDRIINFILK